MPPPPGTLYIVATPIGNLADVGERARAVLAGVDFVAAEDTRRTARLLNALGTARPLISLHEHNEAERTPAIVRRLLGGESAALVSDAGTPLVSDPGYRLVRAAQQAGIGVVPIPGPSAVTTALSGAGLATDRFVFEGFLPARGPARRKRIAELAREPRTLVFFEAPHRLSAMLADCAAGFGAAREAALARELTKLHESIRRAPLGELVQAVAAGDEPALGECVVLVSGVRAGPEPEAADVLLRALAAEGVGPKTAAAVARRMTGASRRELYRRAHELADRGLALSDDLSRRGTETQGKARRRKKQKKNNSR